MVSIRPADVDRFMQSPPAEAVCILVFGSDLGLVHERAEALARAAVDDAADPFALVRLDGDELAPDPGRLVDEAQTVPLFGGRRAIWVRLGSRSIAPALEAVLAGPKPEARIILEGGDLKRGAPVRSLCERHRHAAALPCYTDSDSQLARVIEHELAEAGLAIDADTRRSLLGLLGADRLATRQEIERLALYAHGRGRVTAADVDAVIADVSTLSLDDVVDAAFAGDSDALEYEVTRLAEAGLTPTAALMAALMHALRLYRIRLENGGAAGAVERHWPNLHFRRKDAVQAALARWRAEDLAAAIQGLGRAIADGRRLSSMTDALAARGLAELAARARRGRAQR